MADWVRLPTILCVLDMTRSAPRLSASAGSSSWKARCAPQASSTTSGTPWLWATSTSPATSATAPKYVGETTVAPTASGVSRSAWSSASGVMQCAMCSSGSSSGATKVGRRPDITSASMVLECALRWVTTLVPWCPSASSATWLPCDAPFTSHQVRLAPHASAASCCAATNGVGSSPTSTP